MAEEIRVFGLDDRTDRAALFTRAEARYARGAVPVADLEDRLRAFVQSMRGVLHAIPEAVGAYRVEQIELRVEVSAKGTVSLLGSGGELGGSGGMTLTLKRSEPEPRAAGVTPDGDA